MLELKEALSPPTAPPPTADEEGRRLDLTRLSSTLAPPLKSAPAKPLMTTTTGISTRVNLSVCLDRHFDCLADEPMRHIGHIGKRSAVRGEAAAEIWKLRLLLRWILRVW